MWGKIYLSLSQARIGARAVGVAVPIARLICRRSPGAAAGSGSGRRDSASSVLSHGGVVLLGNVGGNAPAVAERDALVFGPGPDVAAAPSVCGGSRRPAALCSPAFAGVFDIGGESGSERGGVLSAQVDLVFGAVDSELHRFIGRA